jgi:hypothetical protein
MASEMLESERRLLATDRRQQNNGGIDHRDPDAHSAAVRDKGSAALKEVRRTAGPDRSGTVRVLIDKVGGNR